MTDFSDLVGKTINKIDGLSDGSDVVRFCCADGSSYIMHHYQCCCEYVCVYDLDGDAGDIIGSPVLVADEVSDAEGGNLMSGLTVGLGPFTKSEPIKAHSLLDGLVRAMVITVNRWTLKR